MATEVNKPKQNHNNADHRAGVVRTALKAAGGSAGGVIGILTAAALGAVPVVLAIVAMIVFGVIMVAALIIAGAFISRR